MDDIYPSLTVNFCDSSRPAMHLSLFSDYSLRVLMFGAAKGDSFQLDEVTDAFDISRHHLAKVVNRLAHLGYLETKRGRGGGISLAMAASEIQIGRLVRQTEDDPAIVECFDPGTNTCILNGACRMKGALSEALNAFYARLDQYTLADLTSGTAKTKLRAILLHP